MVIVVSAKVRLQLVDIHVSGSDFLFSRFCVYICVGLCWVCHQSHIEKCKPALNLVGEVFIYSVTHYKDVFFALIFHLDVRTQTESKVIIICFSV